MRITILPLLLILLIGTGCMNTVNSNETTIIDTSINLELDQQYNTHTIIAKPDAYTTSNFATDSIPSPKHTIPLTISAIGDCTLGTDETFYYSEPFYTFDEIFEMNDSRYDFFFENVVSYLGSDDLTIANLETTLTDATAKANKKFRFKGPTSYVNILTEGSIEAVNLANNHSLDYLKQGFEDTKNILTQENITFFEESHSALYQVKGIQIGLIGLRGWFDDTRTKNLIKEEINELKELGADYIIISFHWGIDRQYYPYDVQVNLAHYSIDQGVDLVLGHHPHVLQGIETYKEKQIVYSLGNFSFGGNHNPEDYDTMIYQQHLTFSVDDSGSLALNTSTYETVPCSVSSIDEYNDFRPTPLTGDEYKRLQQKIDDLSNF